MLLLPSGIYPKVKFYLKNPILQTIENYFGHVLCSLTYHLSNSVGLSMARKERKRWKGWSFQNQSWLDLETVTCHQTVVCTHLDKKLNYFLIEFLLQ